MPIHKRVQASQTGNEFRTGAEEKMISIGKHEGGTSLPKLVRREGFNSALRANRGEDGGFNKPVGSLENAGTGMAISCDQVKLKVRQHGVNYTFGTFQVFGLPRRGATFILGAWKTWEPATRKPAQPGSRSIWEF